jgi:hypothetical protein
MTKKCLWVLLLLGMITVGISAQSGFKFSLGAGGYFTNDFGGGLENKSAGTKTEIPHIGGGVLAFFDATYVKLSVGMLATNLDDGVTLTERAMYGIDIGLFGKFPFYLGERFIFFPLLGIDYRMALSAADINGEPTENNHRVPGDFSAFWLKAGVGLDFSFNDFFYIRGEALYGVRLANAYETKRVNLPPAGSVPRLGHGATVNIALGYRLN